MIKLTSQQQRVHDLIVKGWSNKEIGDSLGISSRTVEAHRAAIFDKTGVRNAVELVHKALGSAS